MDILHLYKDYYPVLGGIENYVKLLAEGQVEQGHRVEVLVNNTNHQTSREIMNGVGVTKAGRWWHPASTPLSPWYPPELYKRLYRQHPPDIIHLHTPYPVSESFWWLGSYLPRFGRQRSRCVITYHSDVIRQKRLLKVYAPLLKEVLQRADLILPTSPNYIETSPFLKPVAKKCRVVPLGIEIERFNNPDPQKIARIRACYPGKLVLFVGKLRYYKGLSYLIEAMKEFPEGVTLLLVGEGPQGLHLRAQVAELGLADRVKFAGEVADEELPAYYAACDLFVLPSSERSEAFGLSMVEAMACGRAVISTELGTGTSYVNQDGMTGRVVPPANPTALASAIRELLAEDQLRAAMGWQGRERVLANFTRQKTLEGVAEAYQIVIKR